MLVIFGRLKKKKKNVAMGSWKVDRCSENSSQISDTVTMVVYVLAAAIWRISDVKHLFLNTNDRASF